MKTGPKYKICRRVGDRVFGKCQTTKFTVSGTEKPRSKKGGRMSTEYGGQLLEKQKARFTYGVTEKQFARYVRAAQAARGGVPAERLYAALESRLDNVVYRLGLAPTRQAARQMVSHGHITINESRNKIPSYSVRAGDRVAVRLASRDKGVFTAVPERVKDLSVPEWLTLDTETYAGVIKALPHHPSAAGTINFSSILEFYSRV